MDPVELAIDGFPLDPGDPDFRIQKELSTWLELRTSPGVPVALRFDPAANWSHWLRPAIRRFAWVRAHRDLIPRDQKLDFRIAHLISHLLNRIQGPEPSGLGEATFAELTLQAAALEESGAGSMFRADTARLLLDLTKAGIRPETRQSLYTMLRALSPEDRLAGMHELAWRLFLDLENTDLENTDDAEPRWSEQVRNELRELKPAKRKPWIGLLKLARIRKARDPKWEQKIKQALDRIGSDDWESRVASWCALLQQAESSALERPGQILLRLLLEIPQVAESPQPQPPNDTQEVFKLLREGRHAGFELAVEYTQQHGYQADIVEAVRQYHATLHGSVTDQARRQHVGWWLWLEDVTPIKPEDCWSGIIRADLRSFTGARKKAWMDLISNMTFAVVARPPAKWSATAAPALASVGPEDFRNQMRRWLALMAGDQPQRLGIAGRDVLRCLIWAAGMCPPDPGLDEALSWIGRTRWKNKESRDRMLKIEGPLGDVLSARNPELGRQLPQRPDQDSKAVPKPLDLGAVMSKAMSKVLMSMPMGDRIEMRPDHIFVRGELDQYRIGLDGVITRGSGRRVHVNMDALPPYITQLVQPAVDAMDLAQGMFQPNRMRLFSLATILAHDAQWESAIE